MFEYLSNILELAFEVKDANFQNYTTMMINDLENPISKEEKFYILELYTDLVYKYVDEDLQKYFLNNIDAIKKNI